MEAVMVFNPFMVGVYFLFFIQQTNSTVSQNPFPKITCYQHIIFVRIILSVTLYRPFQFHCQFFKKVQPPALHPVCHSE